MPPPIENLRDLVRLLEERPEWRAELRRLLLTDELLALPQLVRDLIEAQRRTEMRVAELAEAQARIDQRVARLEEAVARLAEAQARTDQRVARLEEAVARLAEAQARTDQRVARLEEAVARLAEAQARTEARVEQLAEAQARTGQGLARLAEAQARTEARVEQLAEAQARTNQGLVRLAEAQARTDERVAELNQRVGYLSNLLGADIEADAEDVLLWVLRGKGYQPGEPRIVDMNGDIDVALPLVDAAGRQLWALAEAKVRVRRGEVLGWARRLRDPEYFTRLRALGIAGPYLAYVFGLRVYEEALAAASEQGVGVLSTRGERVSPAERA
jgi:hypothetical protein